MLHLFFFFAFDRAFFDGLHRDIVRASVRAPVHTQQDVRETLFFPRVPVLTQNFSNALLVFLCARMHAAWVVKLSPASFIRFPRVAAK